MPRGAIMMSGLKTGQISTTDDEKLFVECIIYYI
jgi:hypothetical protein